MCSCFFKRKRSPYEKSTWLVAQFEDGKDCEIEVRECEDQKSCAFFLGTENIILIQGKWDEWIRKPIGALVFQNRNARKISVFPKMA